MTGQDVIDKGRQEVESLYKALRIAENEYLDLRDAKSDGCCYGKSIAEVLQYDAKIDRAAQVLNKARESYLRVTKQMSELRREYGYEE